MSKNWQIAIVAEFLLLLGLGGYALSLQTELKEIRANLPRVEPLAERIDTLEVENAEQTQQIELIKKTEAEALANLYTELENRLGELRNSLNQLRQSFESGANSAQANAAKIAALEKQVAGMASLQKEISSLRANQQALESKLQNALYATPE